MLKNSKKLLVLVLICTFVISFFTYVHGQRSYLGSQWFNAINSTFFSITLAWKNIPYVAFVNGANSNKASVMKRNGSSWGYVGGTTIWKWSASYTQIVLDSNWTPYIAYSDTTESNKLTVKYFDGGSWKNLWWIVWVSQGAASFVSMVIDNSDRIYVWYRDESIDGRAMVKYRDGENWKDAWSPEGFSAGSTSNIDLFTDGTDVFIAYQDLANEGKTTAMQRKGPDWITLWNGSFGEPGYNPYQQIVVTSNGKICVAFSQEAIGWNLTVQCLTKWTRWSLWQDSVSEGQAQFIAATVDNSGNIFISYIDVGLGNKIIVKKWNNTEQLWETIWDQINDWYANYLDIVINDFEKVFIAYTDEANEYDGSVQTFETVPLDCKVTWDECQVTIWGTPTTTVTIKWPTQNLALVYSPAINPWSIISWDYAALWNDWYFKIIDEAGTDEWYYSTLQATDLIGLQPWSVIPAQNIRIYADQSMIQTLVWLVNTDIEVWSLDTTPSLNNTQLFLNRWTWSNMNRVGEYWVQPIIEITIPQWTTWDTYTWSITYTLYDNQ